jgi:hypothetical protein
MSKISKFDGQDYIGWKLEITDLLQTKDLYYEQDEIAPVGFKEKNALAFVRLNMERSKARLIADAKTIKDAFDLLDERFLRTGHSELFFLQSKLSTMKLSDNGDVTEHLAVFEDTKKRLEAALGSSLTPTDITSRLINGLPKSFDSIKAMVIHGDDGKPCSYEKDALMIHWCRQVTRHKGHS